ncbi:MAG TPA: c-type cytochrome, partial [Burkholderiaceae bacterium]|nr:c-type cytochrome [Burkholderiaceae bacterium]
MKGFFRAYLGIAATLFAIHAVAANAAAGDVAAGKFKSEDQRCQECHGSDGNGERPERKYAKLAGQFPEYLVKQLQDYRSGARQHDFMSMSARNMDDADIADISAYYASQSRMHGDGGGNDAVGKNLFQNGDASRNILPCASCHVAIGATGTEINNPILAGQERNYLEQQIFAWRNGERSNS